MLRTIRGTMEHCVRDRLRDVPHPTLLVSGAQDRIVNPAHAAQTVRNLPHGHYLSIPSCGHAPQMEKAGFINRLVVHFLSSPRPGTQLPLSPLSLARANTIL